MFIKLENIENEKLIDVRSEEEHKEIPYVSITYQL